MRNTRAAELAIGTRRSVELLVTLCAAGELAVGLLVAWLPDTVMGILLGAPLDATGTVAARMTGIAVAALGLAWWPDRNRLDPQRLREVAIGFIVYNLGVGLLFLSHAWGAGRPLPVSWLVAAVHLLAGGAFTVILYRQSAPAR